MASALETKLSDALKEIERLKKKIKRLEEDADYIEDENEIEHDDKFWKRIREKIKKRDVSYIKQQLQENKLSINETDDEENTLLLIAASEGNYEVVSLCINLGADINHQNIDGDAATDLAEEEGYFHVEQLLLFESQDAAIGSEVTEYASKLNKQQGIINNLIKMLQIKKNKKVVQDTIVDIICQQIRTQQPFSDLLLNLSWRFITENATNPLDNQLWKTIQQTAKEIIERKKEKEWFWLKNYLLPSTVWLIDLSPPKKDGDEKEEDEEEEEEEEEDEEDEKEHDDDDDDGKKKKKKKKKKRNRVQYLFYELLKVVKKKADSQIDDLVIPMNKLESESPESWNELIKWDIATMLEEKCRQDAVNGGVKPDDKHTKEYLTKNATTNATFNVVKHYDYNEYLSKLVLTAHMVDDEYQRSIQDIFEIDADTQMYTDEKTGDTIRYLRGPVKLMERCKSKAETDYRNEAFPTSANVLDINRCSLVFDKISVMLNALKKLENKIKYYQSGCIIAICRDKNGFTEYVKNPQYADIKLNVLISGSHGTNIIGELQFLLQTMMDFKHKAHGLYAITRRQELFDGMGQILPTLLDEKRKLFVAGGLGDMKTICDLMITNNKTDKEIMQFDDKNKECILMNICCLGHLKTLKKLKGILYETVEGKQLFLNGILSRNDVGFTAFEFVTNDGQLNVLQYLCKDKSLKKQIVDCQDDLYRLFLMALSSEHKSNFKYIIQQFSISDELIDTFFEYKIEEKEEEKEDEEEESIKKGPEGEFPNVVFAVSLSNDDIDRLQLLLKVGNDRFIKTMFETSRENINAIESMLQNENEKQIQFIFNTKPLRNAIINNNNKMYRFLHIAIYESLWNPILFNKIINDILKIDDETWKKYLYYDQYDESLDAKYLNQSNEDNEDNEDDEDRDSGSDGDEDQDEDENDGDVVDVFTFFDKSLFYRAMYTGNEEMVEKFVDILLNQNKKDLMDFLMAPDKNEINPFMIAMENAQFECAHIALTKVKKKKDKQELLDCCQEIEDEEVVEKIQEWQGLL